MSEEEMVNLKEAELHKLIKDKLMQAGMPDDQAEETANHLTYADMNGVHSHGAVRVEYYAERIYKGGVNLKPKLSFEKTGPATAIYHGDNAQGHYVANKAIPETIKLAKEAGSATVGISEVSHTGTLSYYVRQFAEADLFAFATTLSDPMVVPFGGAEVYYGTNPIAFAAPRANAEPIVFDMATTVQAWGKILDARSKHRSIPDDWAVDGDGRPTTDPHKVEALLPIAGPKGYGLMMLADMLSGVLLGLPSGKNVSSMYHDLSEYRNLGQAFIVIDPERFAGLEHFKQATKQNVEELHQVKPAPGYEQVYYPGELSAMTHARHEKEGVDIPKEIVDYLKSDDIHFDRYDHKGIFAE